MKVYDAYRMAIEAGISKDPRPQSEVRRVLDRAKEAYDNLPEDRKDLYDMERLWNPYTDSRFSALSEEAKDIEADTMIWGIDIGPAEILLADRLKEKGRDISAVVAHHPIGTARTRFPEVMDVIPDIFHSAGMPINVAEGVVAPRREEVLRGVMGSNYNQGVDAAKLLGIPLFNVHCPADNMVQDHLTRLMEDSNPCRLKDVINALYTQPEVREAARYNSPPTIMVGSGESRCGKIMCKMTGGTSFSKESYEKLAEAGVGTVICMHFPDNHYDEARKYNINLVVSGHMSCDSIGVNLICDLWEKEGIKVLPCSGFTRYSRN